MHCSEGDGPSRNKASSKELDKDHGSTILRLPILIQKMLHIQRGFSTATLHPQRETKKYPKP